MQALVRADALAGNGELGAALMDLIDAKRWPEGGLTSAQLHEIRRLKARVEAERLPRGANPAKHTKLGPGGLADIEWTVQMLQLEHAHAVPELRTLVDAVRGPLAGDLAALRRAFSVTAVGAADGWTLGLVPLDPRAARLLRQAEVSGRGSEVLAVRLVQANGDEQQMAVRPLP